MGYDYTNSGMSTGEAIEDFHKGVIRKAGLLGIPKFISRFIPSLFRMVVGCDGGDCENTCISKGKVQDGNWSLSEGWVHSQNLDFCPSCQKDGSMAKAIADGVLPRGAYPLAQS
jgi:hypothetical protein